MFVRNKNNFYPILRKDFERFLTNILRIGYFYLYDIIMKEVFKAIQGYEGHYQVSNLGRVKSLERPAKHSGGGELTIKEKILKPHNTHCGYPQVILSLDGETKTFTIHRLVALTFINNTNKLVCVNHMDGNKENNSTTNLEWVSYKENLNHAYKTGLWNTNGVNNGNVKLKANQVTEIRRLFKKGNLTQQDLADMFNCSRRTIHLIIYNKTWRHILTN